jgi:hypothetical protein
MLARYRGLRPWLVLSVFLMVFDSGCESSPESPASMTRDSAGITIVESVRPAWEEDTGWRVGGDPLLRLGVVDGDEAFQFTGITGLVRLSDGTIVVGDGGSGEVRFFDPSGGLRARAGGSGEGPGEFVGMAGLGTDSEGNVWVYDFSLRRVTRFDADGEMVGMTTLGPEPPTLFGVGSLSDGTFLLKQLWGSRGAAGATELGFRRDPVAFVRFGLDGGLVDTLALFPGRELMITEEDGRAVMSTPPFDKNTSSALWDGGLVAGTQDRFELTRYSPDGTVVRIIRIPVWDLTVKAEDLEQYIQGRLAQVPEDRRPGLRQELEAMPSPSSKPAYGGLRADEAGNLWVAEWVIYPDMPEGWTVLDPDGAWLGTVDIPGRFTPYAIGDDWILGVELDELDVEYVVLYPLLKV